MNNENAKDAIIKVLECIADNPMKPYPIPGNQAVYLGAFVPDESAQAQTALAALRLIDSGSFRVAANIIGIKLP